MINLLFLNIFLSSDIVPASSKEKESDVLFLYGRSLWSAISWQRKWLIAA